MNQPSDSLLELLARLRLVTAGQVQNLLPQVRRLAGELPQFDSVWIDALVQARLLTPFQGSEWLAGRGAQLSVGPYVLVRPRERFGWADCFQARELATGRTVRLYLVRKTHEHMTTIGAELARLAELSKSVSSASLLPIESSGLTDGRAWAATLDCCGKSAASWMVENGRFPPAVALHIARLMLVALTELEQLNLVHGDISAAALLTDGKRAWLAHPGLRAIVRPAEGYAHDDLVPSAYDYLAPERVAAGTLANSASDVYACGALWWHLLTGRPPLAGGNSLGKLQAAHAARIGDVRRLAPDTPPEFANAISQCLSRDPSERPARFAELAARLGAPARDGARAYRRLFDPRRPSVGLLGSPMTPPRIRRRRLERVSAGVLVAALFVAACWPAWRRGDLLPQLTAQRPSAGKGKAPPHPDASAATAQPGGTKIKAQATANTLPKETAGAVPVAYWTEPAVTALVLPSDRPIDAEQLSLAPRQTVCAAAGGRARVVVPARGLLIAVEDVKFENIDFVASRRDGSQRSNALVSVLSTRITFRGCRFVQANQGQTSAAIAWRGPLRGNRSGAGWSGQLTLDRCHVRGLSSAIEAPNTGRAIVELTNSLFVDCSAVVCCKRPLPADQACELMLDHVTVRECGPVVQLSYEELPNEAGALTVSAVESTLAPRDGLPLVLFQGDASPMRLLATVEWQGQGSLVTEATPIAGWRTPAGDMQTIDDDELVVAGLARSPVEFAGTDFSRADESCTVRWQVPLQSAEPPGIGTGLP